MNGGGLEQEAGQRKNGDGEKRERRTGGIGKRWFPRRMQAEVRSPRRQVRWFEGWLLKKWGRKRRTARQNALSTPVDARRPASTCTARGVEEREETLDAHRWKWWKKRIYNG